MAFATVVFLIKIGLNQTCILFAVLKTALYLACSPKTKPDYETD